MKVAVYTELQHLDCPTLAIEILSDTRSASVGDQGFALEGRGQRAMLYEHPTSEAWRQPPGCGRRIKPTSSFLLQDTSPVVYDGKGFGRGTSLFQTSELLPSAFVAQRLLPSFDILKADGKFFCIRSAGFEEVNFGER